MTGKKEEGCPHENNCCDDPQVVTKDHKHFFTGSKGYKKCSECDWKECLNCEDNCH